MCFLEGQGESLVTSTRGETLSGEVCMVEPGAWMTSVMQGSLGLLSEGLNLYRH